jgi:hypothetical protein
VKLVQTVGQRAVERIGCLYRKCGCCASTHRPNRYLVGL